MRAGAAMSYITIRTAEEIEVLATGNVCASSRSLCHMSRAAVDVVDGHWRLVFSCAAFDVGLAQSAGGLPVRCAACIDADVLT